jgi:hypothetical protein
VIGTDAAGNTTTVVHSYEVVDVTAPVVTVVSPADGAVFAQGELAVASYSCVDEAGGSGLASCDGEVASGAAIDTSTLGAGSFTVTGTDAAGNTTTVVHSYEVVDVMAPVVSVVSPVDGELIGQGESVMASYSCVDEPGGSGLVSCVGDLADGAEIDTSTLGARSFTVTGTDAAGNTTTVTHSYEVVDVTAPVVTVESPADGAAFGQGELIVASYSCEDEDGGSGVVSCVGDLAVGAEVDTSTPGSGSFTVVGTDAAGNTATVVHSYEVLPDDLIDPVITITSPTAITYTADTDLTVGFEATDAESGIASVAADLDGIPITDGTVVDLARDLIEALTGGGQHTLTVVAEDNAGNTATESVTFTVIKRPTIITYSGDTSGQHSDAVSLSATLTDDGLSPLAGKTVTFMVGTQTTSALTDASGVAHTTLVLTQPSSSTTVTAGFSGDAEYAAGSTSTGFTIEAEDTRVVFDDDNPPAIEVTGPGSDASVPFSLTVHITELELAGTGEADLSRGAWTIDLVPVGPGGRVTPVSCDPVVITNGVLSLTCDFDAAPVNTYEVVVEDTAGYFRVTVSDVVTVYDPSLGFATGGGWFWWPGTTDKTNFGFTMKYNKKGTNLQGSLLMIRHTADGNFRIKSNALFGLAVGDGDGMGWASFSGKATYKEPLWLDAEGNHEFTVYVEDRGADGIDQIWIQLTDKDRVLIGEMSMTAPGDGNTVPIEGGNIVVPHLAQRGKKD